MSSVRTSTIAYASIGTVVTGCLAYAVYFDYKRRNDPDFRKALKSESRKQARLAKTEAEEAGKKDRQQLRAMVDASNEEGYPKDPDDKEAYFMDQVSQGEQMCQDGASTKEAALCLFKAMKVYPQPTELMGIYDKTIPKLVLDKLAEMVAYDRTSDTVSMSSSAGVE